MARAVPIAEPPPGFVVRHDFLSPEEERELLARFAEVELHEVRMHGVVARRKVQHFGWNYGYESWKIERSSPIPCWLAPFRDRAAELAGVERTAFEQCLLARYPPGAGIGWHRDAPMFGPVVAGVSLGGACRFHLRRELEGKTVVYKLELPPRSAYVIAGEARTAWQHHVPPVKELRWSLSFRTVKDPAKWDALAAAVPD